jgi:hypothetical protein
VRYSQEGAGDFRESATNTIQTEHVKPEIETVVGRNQGEDSKNIQVNYFDEEKDDLAHNFGKNKQKFDIRKQINQLNNSAMSKFDGVPKSLLKQPMFSETPL